MIKLEYMLSIVIPVFNEEDSLINFHKELSGEINALKYDYEIIFVDDGSTDSSLKQLKSLANSDKRIRIYSFRKNIGKAEALSYGFQMAKGEIIVTLDADLQDKPSEIKKLLDKQKNKNADLISGWRKNRKDKSKMIIISKMFNFIVGIIFGVRLHDYNCGLKVYTKEAAQSLKLYGGQHRFIPALLHQNGFSVDEVAVEHDIRRFGKSKYGFSKVWKDLPDMFTMLFLAKYSKRPLHFFGPVGGFMELLGFFILVYLSVIKLVTAVAIGGRPLLLFGILLIVSGLQIFFTGFLAELITNFQQKNNEYILKYSKN